MLVTTHVITSAAVGTTVQSIPAAFLVSFLLHLLLDTFRHWNFFYERHRPIIFFATLDFTAGIIITYIFIGQQLWSPLVIAAISGGLSPDIPSLLHSVLRTRKNAFLKFHNRLQYETNSVWRGTVSQLIAIVVALLLLLNK